MPNKYVYNFNTGNEFTLTADMGLYCDMASARVLIQSIFPIGSFIGLIVVNLLSDTRGRKFAFQLTLSICLVGILCNFLFNVSHSVRRWVRKSYVFIVGSVRFRVWLLSNNTTGIYNTLRLFKRFLSSSCSCYHQRSWVFFLIIQEDLRHFYWASFISCQSTGSTS